MKQRIQSFLVIGLILGAICLAQGFSLLGPLNGNAWQTRLLGYQMPGDIGSPVNLNEEYRWNTPVICYAFDQSFLNYFGAQGMRDVESAIAVLNNLPAVSSLSTELNEFPTDNKRINYTAQALGVQDLKSTTLSQLLELLGLASPERWAWCIRDRQTYAQGGVTYTNYLVVQRNFDPVTYQPTNRVNSTFYSYYIGEPLLPGNYADAIEEALDPVNLLPYSSVAGGLGEMSSLGSFTGLGPGEVYPGLTRDDVGGLRYILRNQNYNVESLADVPGTITLYTNLNNANANNPANSPLVIYTGGMTNGGTNVTYTNIFLLTNFPPWTIWPGGSNLYGTNITNFILTNIAGSNLLMQTGLRPGIEKLKFVRLNYDSLLGQGFTPVTNIYKDYVVSNWVMVTQVVQRVITAPDIIFTAQDLGTVGGGSTAPVLRRRGVNFVNNDAVNGTTPHAGPGNLTAPTEISFTDILPGFINDDGPNYPTPSWSNSTPTVIWGSFQPTMDVPITVYPSWVSIQELEQMVLRPPATQP